VVRPDFKREAPARLQVAQGAKASTGARTGTDDAEWTQF
jgi:hypothetical protein